MSNDQLKQSLIKIRESLKSNEAMDEETLALAKALEIDLSKLVAADDASIEEIETSMDLATALEARFESDHPVAASFVREIINALHKMGI
ncbi:hypothetical protein TDB9533_01481 [Thalassocella blandensis]|nr:hypothetical protein TDB9533_01481 [Thalassocella blandensis]